MAHISVTQLAHACADEAWLQRWLAGEKPATQCYTPTGKMPVHGTVFHHIVEQFTEDLLRKHTAHGNDESHTLWQTMYDTHAYNALKKLITKKYSASSLLHLTAALQAFCQHIHAMRLAMGADESWSSLFLAQEFSLKGVVLYQHQGVEIMVNGRMDAVRRDAQHALYVVDYKLSHGNKMKQDMLQLCIYAAMLRKARQGLAFQGVLEYYEPEVQPTVVSAADMTQLFDDCVQPVLARMVEQSPRGATVSTMGDDAAGAKAEVETETDLSQCIVDSYAAFRLEVTVTGKQAAPQLWRYQLRPGYGVKVISLANRAADLQVSLGLPNKPLIQAGQGCVTLDIPRLPPQLVAWQALEVKDVGSLPFPVGVGIDGAPLIADFTDAHTCHALIAGSSGSGKSEWLKSLVASLVANNNPEQLLLSIVDPKILTFGSVKQCSHLAEPIIHDVQMAIAMLQQRVADMNQRYQQLADEGVESLGERMRSGRTDIPWHVIIFDEFADLVLVGKSEKTEFEQLVGKIATKGRAAGIHLVLATQRPDRHVVTGQIKANLPLKICLRVTSEGNSRIILDEGGGETLFGRGDLLCDRGRGIERAQSLYIAADTLVELTRSFN
ncbi:MAG: DNA translocase FtsK [Mariprofundaceae bacterium]|nr:DNA translocase FtsK [Mariprofundaceae bacterium]